MLPPATAMTRIMYQSITLNGSRVPASAFVLWPYAPASVKNGSTDGGGYPIVAWARGTSGFTTDGASSNHRSLVQHWLAPFPLAVNGYVVVAPDYAGLGVSRDAAGRPIVHEYLTLPSHADDLIYAVRAAQRHFRELSARFVVLGHSQGGGAAWAVAVRQARYPVPGYLGAVAMAPLVDIIHHLQPAVQELMGTAICPGVKSAFPGFEWGSVLTAQGEQRLTTILATGAQWGSAVKLLQGIKLMRDGWRGNPYVAGYNARASLVGKAVAGPLLVVHGEKDELLQMNYTALAVREAVRASPGNKEVEYVVLPGVGHDAALTAGHRLWMDWIADRFTGKKSRHGRGERVELTPARPVGSYQGDLNWYLASTAEAVQAPP
ncbi:MAG: hypothetical protein Q9193_005027 [Seirophora villosa]